jgi:hypothetical protein
MGGPVLGSQNNPYLGKKDKQLSLGYRYQRSFRHFVGTKDQTFNRKDIQINEVINTTSLFDVTGTFGFDHGLNLAVSIPYFVAKRSGRDGLDLVNFAGTGNTSAQPTDNFGIATRLEQGDVHEISDMSVILRKWLGSTKQTKGNVALGIGADVPTGDNDKTRIERFIPAGQARVAGNVRTRRVTLDQSIQPGDGEWGIIFDLSAFRTILNDKASLYLSGAYLANPEDTNGVPTFRGGRMGFEAIMSSADQYLLRTGVSFFEIFGRKNLHFALGGRWEGVPIRDVFGDSNGFRRPGYAISIEPTITRTVGRESFSIAVPWAVQRNRQASVPDELGGNGDAGDAAFADYLILTNYSRRF